jgi:hypothetical protein
LQFDGVLDISVMTKKLSRYGQNVGRKIIAAEPYLRSSGSFSSHLGQPANQKKP